MIDLKTCLRPELVEAYQKRGAEIKQLKQRLKQYESEQSDDEKEKEFQNFWKMYGKKGNLKTSRSRFNKLTKKNKEKAMKALPAYVKSTYKDARYPSRKNAEVWISKEGWNDEVFDSKDYQSFDRPSLGAKSFYKHEEGPSSTVDYSSMIAKMKTAKRR